MSQFLFVLANLPCGKKYFLMHSRVLTVLTFILLILEQSLPDRTTWASC